MACLLAISGALAFCTATYVNVKVTLRRKQREALVIFDESIKPWLHTDDK